MAALRRTADLLDHTAQERSRVAEEATREWRGRYREEFDERLDRMLTRARELANQCRDAAARIAWADHQAYIEQRHREWERERWRREKEAEERQRLLQEEGE
jgi:hypothetical protein